MTPVYFHMADIARAVGKTTRTTRQWLRRHGVPKKIGGRWVVPPEALRRNCPEIYRRLAPEGGS